MASISEVQRLDNDISAAQQTADSATDKAEKALYGLDKHEEICSLRYQAIDEKLRDLKKAIYICLIILAALMKSDKLAGFLKLAGFGI